MYCIYPYKSQGFYSFTGRVYTPHPPFLIKRPGVLGGRHLFEEGVYYWYKVPSKNSQQDLDKNLAWISARSCMISQEFGTPCNILLHLDKILSRFLWDFASCKILQDFGTYPTKSCNILLRSCGVFLQGVFSTR